MMLIKGKLKLIFLVIWIVLLVLFVLSLYFNEYYELENEKYICWEILLLEGFYDFIELLFLLLCI